MGVQRDRAARAFAGELNWINSPAIREFVLDCFDRICPEYFWERAASSSGKYHPEFVVGKGGLVRHVKYAVWWGDELIRAFYGTGNNNEVNPHIVVDGTPVNMRDVVVAALILHDMVKDGDEQRTLPKTKHKMVQYHGVELMEAIRERVLQDKKGTIEQVLIMCGVAAHMGCWTQPTEYRPASLKGSLARKVAWIVHLADYSASRKVDGVIPTLAQFQP